jgi:lactate racemase
LQAMGCDQYGVLLKGLESPSNDPRFMLTYSLDDSTRCIGVLHMNALSEPISRRIIMASIRLMEYEWSDNPHEVEYFLPDTWDTTIYHIQGYQKPVLTDEQINDAIISPAGSPRIRDLCKGKQKVCVLFDDMSRGTPTFRIIPHILRELQAGGVKDNQIEFICALGAHQAFDRSALARKVGENIIAKYPVYNHSPFTTCSSLGKTSYGTKVEVNSEVMDCDLKISIAGVVPHPMFGYGGGGKIVMPGVSSWNSIVENHSVTHKNYAVSKKNNTGAKGVVDNNPFTADALEFTKMAGIDFSINCLLNEKAELVEVYAGDSEISFKLAVKTAHQHYLIPDTRDNDIVIANAFCKVNEAILAAKTAFIAVKRTGGTAVTLANTPLGQVVHYLNCWGTNTKLSRKTSVPEWVDHCVFYSEFPEAKNKFLWTDEALSKTSFPSNWDEVIRQLLEWHGPNARVAVFPDATNQYSLQPNSNEHNN